MRQLDIGRLSLRLRQLRLALGLSMDDLVSKIERIVSKQALSKYERGQMAPSASVLTKLAEALGVKSVYLLQPPQAKFRFLGFRKRASLGNREQKRVQNMLIYELEKRIRLCMIMNHIPSAILPLAKFGVRTPEDSERAATRLRDLWKLGLDPIANLTQVLEGNGIQVVVVSGVDTFDGISAIAYVKEPRYRIGAVVIREGIPGDRQRLDLAHELGHLVLNVAKQINSEKCAFRFAGAFLAPAETLYAMIGRRRRNMSPQELLLLKKHFGMSMAALIYRLRDLGIITQAEYRSLCIYLTAHGWRKVEPEAIPAEKPQWLQQLSLRAKAEGLISAEEAEHLSGHEIGDAEENDISPRKLMRMSAEERRRIILESLGHSSNLSE